MSQTLLATGPFFLQLSITDRCNSHCLHCYRQEDRGREFPPEAFGLLLEQYNKLLGYLNRPSGRIEITGGEPLAAPGLRPFLAILRGQGIRYRILSNGSLFSRASVAELKRLGLAEVQISLEGNEETHDAIRGEGSFRKAWASAELLVRSGVQLTVSTTLSRLNCDEIASVCKLGKTLSARLFFSRLVPRGRAKGLASHLLTGAGWLEAMSRIFRHRTPRIAIAFRDPTWVGFFLPRHVVREGRAISGCAAGYHGLAIDSDGSVYPCRRLPVVIGNILNDDIIKVWNHPVMQNLRHRDRLKGRCGSCEYRWRCGGCRAIAYALKDDYLDEDPQCPWDRRFMAATPGIQ